MDLPRPFIRLPYAFDAERMAAEAEALPASAWLAHPSRMAGNSAVALISRDGGDNDDFEGTMVETGHLHACPAIRQAIGSFGEVFGRSRLMKLAAGSEVSTHVDFNYHWYTRVRIHIPLVTNPGVTFYCADQNVHMRAGECWIFNSWRRHRVTNESNADRIHLVIDTAGSSRFWETVHDMSQYDPVTDVDAVESRVEQIAYVAGQQTEIRTERFNVAPVMSPGEVDALVSELVRDFGANTDNDSAIVARYQAMLFRFTKDWREIWHSHGYQASGVPLYQAAIEAVQSALDPNPRALLTASNKVGVNPVIVQRILRAALHVDIRDQFTG
ncbi:MAG: aspartyl/asparaginyl beta-hydroxylase domain-containing protein [Pseudomonadota bacterium]